MYGIVGSILGLQAMSFVERFIILFPYLGESTVISEVHCRSWKVV